MSTFADKSAHGLHGLHGPCPVDGEWSSWNKWGKCSVTCDSGLQTRSRTCDNPKPANGGSYCRGRSSESRACNRNNCPIDGGWSEWSQWSLCTKTVNGIQIKNRECVNPKPKYGGKICSGHQVVLRECRNMSSCHEEFPVSFQTEEVPSLGIWEINKGNSWEKLCTGFWGDAEENVTCLAMGYYNNGPVENGTWYKGNTTIHRNCASLTQNCTNTSKDKPQLCKVPVRLNGANIEYGGRVEIFYRGSWGRICRREWDFDDVKVVCRQLGFKSALAEFIRLVSKDEKIPFLMSNVACTGDESDLASCKRTDGEYDCQDDEEAQALCEPKNREFLETRPFFTQIDNDEKITCSLGNDTDYIRWYDGAGIELMNKSQRIKVSGGELTIDKVKLSDAGTYQCRGLTYTRPFTIYVMAEFTNITKQQTFRSGEPGTIQCTAHGAPTPQFEKWTKCDHEMDQCYKSLNETRFTQLPGGSLRVDPFQPGDKGKYRCKIKQTRGGEEASWKSQRIDVSVLVRPVIQLSGPRHPLREGDNVSLNCTITEGSPEPIILWLKNKTSLYKGDKTLFLREVTYEDAGKYTCKAENDGGVVKDSIYVAVDIPPKVNPELKNQSVNLNSTFTMKCTVGGNPSPKVKWTKNGSLLMNTSNTLNISHISFDDAAGYGCSAENRAGKFNKKIWIDVTVSPQVYVFPRKQTVPEGNATTISCKAIAGTPKPTLTWKFEDGDLPSVANVSTTEEGSLLNLSNTTKGMEGIYKCTATNKADNATSSATVHVLERPTVEISPKLYPAMVIGDTLKLTCEGSESTIEIKWKKNGALVSSRANRTSTLVIEEVEISDSGNYSCEAHNQAGFMSSTVEIEVREFPGAPSHSTEKILEWYYIVGPLSAVITVTFVSWYFCKRRMAAKAAKQPRRDQEQGFEMEAIDCEVDEWEISRHRIVLRDVIGKGAFGAVWRATLSQPVGGRAKQIVAAKCFTPTAGEEGRKALMREIELGKRLGQSPQPNIVKFLGCVTAQIHPILIMEYLPCGDLLGYLRKSRGIEDQYHHGEGEALEVTTYDMVSFAKQIATGMVFLGSRGVVHRDLAARNVLIDRNFTCKVSDFGMAYQNFKYGHGKAKKGCVPVKWTAPEILFGNPASLSSQSDVWSYGIVLYEIFTIGTV